MLFRGTNTKSMNLKVSVSPIPDFWKGFRMSLGHVFIGKKARPSWDSVFQLCRSEASCSETDNIFCISAFKKAVLTICW